MVLLFCVLCLYSLYYIDKNKCNIYGHNLEDQGSIYVCKKCGIMILKHKL